MVITQPIHQAEVAEALMFAENGVAVNGWTLHLARLAAAVACFAPAVQVIDASTGLVVNPNKRG